jgi:molybdate transport system substrate-binding protein
MKPLLPAGLLPVGLLLWAAAVRADETTVAVAANFTEPATEIAELFEARTGHTAVLSFGASGQFFTQIAQGAPFDVFLSADAERPARAVEEGLGVADTAFTYAIGRLVLWSRDPGRVTGPETLAAGDFARLATADPAAAPYGAAALETMRHLDVLAAVEPKLVTGTNISQAFQFVATGNAELGFVALSQLAGDTAGSRWVVPAELHAPIRQDAVLLTAGADNAAARAFLDFLKGPEAAAVIERFGYGLDRAPEGAAG